MAFDRSLPANRDLYRMNLWEQRNFNRGIDAQAFREFLLYLLRLSQSSVRGRTVQLEDMRGQKRRRLADSQAPLLKHNQCLPYLTGSPPSRQGCRYAHYKSIFASSLWTISIAGIAKTNEKQADSSTSCEESQNRPLAQPNDGAAILDCASGGLSTVSDPPAKKYLTRSQWFVSNA